MYVKTDKEIIDILRCPLCKSEMELQNKEFHCSVCKSSYPLREITSNNRKEQVYDFRIPYPEHIEPYGWQDWRQIQHGYIQRSIARSGNYDKQKYIEEIEGVRDIYSQFKLKGKILDIGGFDGRLRQHLDPEKIQLYMNIDPMIEAFNLLPESGSIFDAYTKLKEPCNFVSSYAEYLPLASESFDIVHIRSVLDHLYNPHLALKESFRVLKQGGLILLGNGLKINRQIKKIRLKRLRKFAHAILVLLAEKYERKSHHMFNWTYEELKKIIEEMGAEIIDEHRWNPPGKDVVYFLARK